MFRIRQQLNVYAFKYIARAFKNPLILSPTLRVQNVESISQLLHDYIVKHNMDIQVIVFDKDNTLTLPYRTDHWGSTPEQHGVFIDELARCNVMFSGRVFILSNSVGSRDDDGMVFISLLF